MNGDGSVRKRPDGRYEARVLLHDGRRISVYGKTAREVTREIRDIKSKDDAGQPIVRNEEKIGAFLETWLQNEIKRRRRAKTYASYAQMVRSHMLRELGAVKLTELTAKRVQVWLGHSSIQMTFDVYGHLFPNLEDDHAKLAAGELAIIGA